MDRVPLNPLDRPFDRCRPLPSLLLSNNELTICIHRQHLPKIRRFFICSQRSCPERTCWRRYPVFFTHVPRHGCRTRCQCFSRRDDAMFGLVICNVLEWPQVKGEESLRGRVVLRWSMSSELLWGVLEQWWRGDLGSVVTGTLNMLLCFVCLFIYIPLFLFLVSLGEH